MLQTANLPKSSKISYAEIVVGKPDSKDKDEFKVGDDQLIDYSVSLSEGAGLSSVIFRVLDPNKKILDKYLQFIEENNGLDPVEAGEKKVIPSEPTTPSQPTEPTMDEQTTTAGGKVLWAETLASTYGWGSVYDGGDTGAYGDKIQWESMTAAMADRKYKYAKIKVTSLVTGKSVVVKIVDRGPFGIAPNGKVIRPLQEHPTRKIDLVRGAWRALTGNAPPGLHKVKIELIEGSSTSVKETPKVIKPTVKPATTPATKTGEKVAKATETATKQKAIGSFNPNQTVRDWPKPGKQPTKNILLAGGHRIDINTGTNGTSNQSLNYAGETRTIESVLTEFTLEVFTAEAKKAGFNVIPPPGLPAFRGDAARRAYQDAMVASGGSAYLMELHYDEPQGRSGVIPGGKYDKSGRSLSAIDVALAEQFGSFSFMHRSDGGGLGAIRRGITILEVSALTSAFTNLTIQAANTGDKTALFEALRPYAKKFVLALNRANGLKTSEDAQGDAVNSTQSAQVETGAIAKSSCGSPITIKLGFDGQTFVANSFIHTGIKFNQSSRVLEFAGHAASWVMTQRIKNSAYSNMTLKQIAAKITKSYGMKLEMDEEGEKYEYFPQRNSSDYESLLTECRRLGFKVYCQGKTLYIKRRENVTAAKPAFVLVYGENMGIDFQINHQAGKDGSGGARSADPAQNNTTGEVKFELDADTGKVKQVRKENLIGTGSKEGQSTFTTGNAISLPKPITTGQKSDGQGKENDKRSKGIQASCEFPTTPEALLITPDTAFKTEGISKTADRYWVVESITHSYKNGASITSVALYSPLKSKSPSPAISSASASAPEKASTPQQPIESAADFDPNAPKFIRPCPGSLTSKHRTENPRRPKHRGIDISSIGGNGAGGKVVAAASGTVTVCISYCKNGDRACGGRGGNYITIDHGGGWKSRYMHLHPGTVKVAENQKVKQGEMLGIEGNSGDSRGTHLHFEIWKGGTDLNPRKYIGM
jgi:murein DD-endopeptidase MepM/ murein hydrolase activator NlpD/rare lipoprotein A (peptidoglycan hydrolase)